MSSADSIDCISLHQSAKVEATFAWIRSGRKLKTKRVASVCYHILAKLASLSENLSARVLNGARLSAAGAAVNADSERESATSEG